MARTIYVPEAGRAIDFPDTASDDQIISYLREKYAPAPTAPPASTEAPIGAIESGLYGLRSRVQTAVGKTAEAAGLDAYAQYLLNEARANQERAAKYQPEISDISQIQGVGDVASFAGSTIGQSIPESAVGIAGAYAGGVAGASFGTAVFPGPGTLVGGVLGGIIGGALASLPSFIGGNLQAQAREKGIPLEETDLAAASVGAIAQAPMDAAFDALIARKLPGSGAVLDAVRGSFFKEIAKTAAIGAATEGLTEPAQQAIEIAQANPEKLREFGPEVQQEILNAAAAGALAGGVLGGVGGGIEAIRTPTEAKVAGRELGADLLTEQKNTTEMKRAAEINIGVEKIASLPQVGRLRLDEIRIEPTKENGLRGTVRRYRIADIKGNSIAEFSDPVLATSAVEQYKKMAGKNIILQNNITGKEIPTANVAAKVTPTSGTTAPKVNIPAAPAAVPAISIPEAPSVTTSTAPETPTAPKVEATGEGLRPSKVFKTALGSQYTVFPDGGTQRIKTPHPGHPVTDVGLKRKSEKTYYIRPEDKYNLDIIQTEGPIGPMAIKEYAPGQIGVKILSGKDSGKFIKGTITKTFDSPEIGLSPLEVWDNGTGTHFGNKITEVNDVPVSEPLTARTDQNAEAVVEPQAEPVAEAPVIETPIGAVGEPAADIKPGELRGAFAAGLDTITVSPDEQAAIRQKIEARTNKIAEEVRASLNRYGLKDVQTKFIPAFLDGMRVQPYTGAAGISGGKSYIKLAVGIFDPDLTVETMVDRVIETLNHETIHSLVDLGILRTAEMQILADAASRAKMAGKSYTYLDYVKAIYDPKASGLKQYADEKTVLEEAVAEMFREWRKGVAGVPNNARGLINRVIETLRRMFGAMKRESYAQIFEDIESGKLGERPRQPRKAGSERWMVRDGEPEERRNYQPENPMLSVSPVYPYGQRVPQSNAVTTNRIEDNIVYGSIVNSMANLFRSNTMKTFIPERYRPDEVTFTRFFQAFADKILPVGQMIDYIRANGGTVTDALDVYMQAQLSQSTTSNDLQERQVKFFEPLIVKLRERGISIAEFEEYLYAKHAKERNDYIQSINPGADPALGSGMSTEEALDIIEATQMNPKYNGFLEAEAIVRQIVEDTNRLRVDSGLTPDFGNMLIDDENGNPVPLPQFEFYVPLRGFADEARAENDIDPEIRARIGSGFKIKGREDMRALGRTSRATDILAHLFMQNSEAVVRAHKNRVNMSLLDLIEANPELAADYGVKILTRGMKPMKKYISSSGVVKEMVDPMYKNRDDILVAKRNGEEIPIQIDNPFLQKALIVTRSADPGHAQKLLNAFQKVNHWLASVNTVYNPEFMIVNFSRDLQQALINASQYEIDGVRSKILKDAPSAAKGVFKIMRNPDAQNEWSDWYKMFREDGGNTSGFWGAFSIEETLSNIEKMAVDPSGSTFERGKAAIASGLKLLEDANGAFENAIRLSVYKNMIEAGVSRQRSAYIAKNLTVNFDQRGEYGPLLNSLYLFYNASVQGTMALAMAATRSKKVQKILGTITIAGLLQDQINSMLSGGEDDDKIYDKIPNYKLENNIVIMDVFGLTEKGYFAIPLPYGANAFYNFGRAFSRNLRGKYTSSEAASSMFLTFVDAFNPIGGTENFLNFVTPTTLDPIVSLYLNEDFSEKRIYPEPFPGSIPKADSQTYFSSTSPAFVNIAQFLNSATGGSEYVPGMISVKPDVIEYIYDYVLGSAGTFAKRMVDTATDTVPKILAGDLQNIEMNNIPVFRKLYGNVSERVSFEDYFDKVNHVLTRGEELKFAIKEGNPEQVRAVRAKFADELSIYPAIKALANRRNKLASELRKVRENNKMPPELKLKRQEILQDQIEQITKRATKLYNDKIGNKYPGLFS